MTRSLSLFLVASLLGFGAAAQNCTLNAGADATICQSQVFLLDGQAGGVISATPNYQWSKISGPGATVVAPSILQSPVSNFGVGVYKFLLSGKCGDNATTVDSVQITVLPDVTLPNAGADKQACVAGTTTLVGNAPATGETGSWILSTASGVNGGTTTFGTGTQPTTTFTFSSSGVKQAIWRITNGTCSKDDTVNVNVLGPATINAGADRTIGCSGSSISLAGSTPGLPPQLGTWSVVSGPNSPVFGNLNSATSTLGNLQVGTYTLRWTVSGPCSNGFDDVVITVSDINPNPNLGADVTYAYCSTAGLTQLFLSDNIFKLGETGLWETTATTPPGTSFTTPTSNSTVVTGIDGAANGSYVFRYISTITATGCKDTALHTVTFQRPITSITAPTSIVLACNVSTATVQTTFAGPISTTNLTRALTFVSGPATAANATRAGNTIGADTWTITGLTTRGTYTYRLQYSNTCSSEFRIVQIFVSGTPPSSNAGSDQLLPCNQLFTTLVGSNVGTGNTGSWSQVSGPNTASIASPAATITNITGLVTGVYVFRWIVSGGTTCPNAQDDAQVTVSSPAVVPANAGADESVCALNPVKLKGNAPAVTQTGTWTVTPAAGVVINDANAPGTTVSGLQPNTVYSFVWTISNACSSSKDTVLFTTNGNTIPVVVNAGADQCLAAGTTAINLVGNAPGANEAASWTGLDGGSITNPTNATTTAAVTANGTYRFVYTLTRNGCGPISDTIVATINAATSIADAGADQSVCSTTIPVSATLSATVPTVGVGAWSLNSGNGSALIASPNVSSTNVSGLSPGSYIFRYTITNGACTTNFDDVQVNVGLQIAAQAGPDIVQCTSSTGTIINLAAIAPASGTGVWSVAGSPAGANVPTFGNPLVNNTTATNFQSGQYTLRWTVSNGGSCPATFDDVLVTMSVTANASSTTNSLCSVTSALLTGNAASIGTWTQTSGPSTSTITALTGSTAIANGLVNGSYAFLYTIPAIGGCTSTSSSRTVVIGTYPTAADAGADATLCAGATSTMLTGNPPTVGTGRWSVSAGGPSVPTVGTGTTVTVTGLVGGLYEFVYTTSGSTGACTSTDSKLVIIEMLSNAGADTTLCAVDSVQLRGNPPAFGVAQWSQVSGPNSSVFNNSSVTSPIARGLVAGTYNFKYAISSIAPCPANEDLVTVIVSPAITATAGPAMVQCQGSSTSVLGTAAQPGVTYAWTPAAGLSAGNVAQPTFTGTIPGTYSYTLNAYNEGCASKTNTSVKVMGLPTNDAPVSLCGTGTQVVSVSNPETGVTYTWSGGLGTGMSKTVGIGSYTVTATISSCPPTSTAFTILPQLDFGDLSAIWPIASAGTASCQMTANAPIAYNAATNPNTSVWAGPKISLETATVGGGSASANTDGFDDGLSYPAIAMVPGYTYPFSLSLNANRAGTTVYYRVWFDWNNNGDLADDTDGNGAAATYAGSAVRNAGPAIASFGVKPPFGASVNYKIRVIVSGSAIADMYRSNSSSYIFQIANGEIEDYSAVVILPVTGLVLQATKIGGSQARLRWQTLTETNTRVFEIEKSVDGIGFYTIGTQEAAGNSNVKKEYDMMEILDAHRMAYYRIKQVDVDGRATYSNTVALMGEQEPTAIVYPNPVKTKLAVLLSVSKAEVRLQDVTGKVLLQRTLPQGYSNIDMQPYANGLYLLVLRYPNGRLETKKIQKQDR